MKTIACTFALLLLGAGTAAAQDGTVESEGTLAPRTHAFVEATGAYGFQFGEQQYLPTTDGSFKHPLTNGYTVGASAGWELVKGLALTGNWEYAAAQSRNGKVTGVLDDVEGTIDYHTISIGLRWMSELGPGRLFGELGAGVVLPFETVVHYDYGTAMGGLATPITGTGKMIDEYNLGVGAYGQLGYQIDLTRNVYFGAALRLKSYASDNDGKQTRFENFVPNMAQPAAVTSTIDYDSSGAKGTQPPRTYSVQDVRAQLAVGFRL